MENWEKDLVEKIEMFGVNWPIAQFVRQVLEAQRTTIAVEIKAGKVEVSQ